MSKPVKGVKCVRIFDSSGGDLVEVGELKKKDKKKKGSRGLKAPERNTRTVYKAARSFLDEIEARHDKSNRKKKDGWLTDGPQNAMRGGREALKKMRKLRVM